MKRLMQPLRKVIIPVAGFGTRLLPISKAERGLEAILRDTWRWQKGYPRWYGAG